MLRGPHRDPGEAIEALRQLGELRIVETVDEALEILRADERFDFVVSETSDFLPLERATVGQRANAVLDTIAEGVCVIDCSGRLLWSNRKFRSFSVEVVERVRQMCTDAWAGRTDVANQAGTVRSRRLSLQTETGRFLEINATPILDEQGHIGQISAVIWDVSNARRLQQKMDAIDNAGSELVRLDADTVRDLDARQRLEVLEDKIIRYTRDLMRFDNFVVRILDKRTQKLELVLCAGLPPEAQHLDVYASTEGNGISGYVAATGRSYICPNVLRDPRYLRGIDEARSSLTVPLRLHDQVVGIFNVESDQTGAFTEDDRQFAEIFGRYVAIALNILDLLVVERHQTTGRLASDVTTEISGPLNDILSDATALREDYIGHDDLRHRLNAISDNVVKIREAIKTVTEPGRGMLGRDDDRLKADPLLRGKTVLVADDEQIIRETVCDVLTKLGCVVETARDGEQAAAMIAHRKYDLLLSDIKIP
ncbi:MAG: GAF domain-containing protein, partial [Phycisphaerae bacterium]|nr:GAF domain-containing protein [Phycisphaerae bacterium]